MPREKWKRKRQKQLIKGPKQGRERLPDPSKETSKSSTRPIEKTKRDNLNLFNWMTVFACVHTFLQPINRGEVVNTLATRPEWRIIVHPVHTVAQKRAPDSPSDLCEVAAIPNERSKVKENLLNLVAKRTEANYWPAIHTRRAVRSKGGARDWGVP